MKKIITFSAVFLGLFFALSGKVQANTFVVHLYYDSVQKILKFDNAYPEKVSEDNQGFVSVFDFSDESNLGEYTAKLYDRNEALLISGIFDAKTGAFPVKIPYISTASSLKIFNKMSDKELFSANLEQFITCNRNGICEFEKEENIETCMVDCASSNVKFSQPTLQTLKDSNNEIKDPETGAVLLRGPVAQQPAVPSSVKPVFYKTLYFYAILVLLLIFIVGIIVYKKFIKK